MSYDVAVVQCGDYRDETVLSALTEAIEQTGGLDFVRPGMTVALKVNLVSAMKPDTAATVHPSVVCAAVKLLRERGARVIIGDSPGGLYSPAVLRHVYDVCGMRQAEALGASLNEDCSLAEATHLRAAQAKHFTYTAWLNGADAIIDMCKLKSHGMMGLSCAVKNMFGTIPGTMKPEFHYKYPKLEDFADMLVDLYEYFRPRLCICDAVIGMEGNGPTQGDPRKIGCLIVSPDGHMLDAVAADMIDRDPLQVATVAAAVRRELVPTGPRDITVYGDPERFRVTDFKTPPVRNSAHFDFLGGGTLGRAIDGFVEWAISPFPQLTPKECVGCGKCAQMCPAKAISMKRKKPRIDRGSCIHCFCCQEFCPKGAMKVGRRPIARLLVK